MSVGAQLCSSCGTPVSANMKFYQSCGSRLPHELPPVPSAPQYPPPYQPIPAKSNTALVAAIVVMVIVVVTVIGGILAIGFFNALSSATTLHSRNIVNGPVTLPGGSNQFYQFIVPAGATLIGVNGTFTASNGDGNGIEVLVLDQNNFFSWENGNQATSYYDSGRVTAGTVSTHLPSPGNYYLVYSNEFPSASSKNVQTTVGFNYRG